MVCAKAARDSGACTPDLCAPRHIARSRPWCTAGVGFASAGRIIVVAGPDNSLFGWACQTPFGARVGDLKSLTFGVALGIAASLGHHHCQIAAVAEGVAHTLLEQCSLQTPTALLRDRCRTSEQGDSLVQA